MLGTLRLTNILLYYSRLYYNDKENYWEIYLTVWRLLVPRIVYHCFSLAGETATTTQGEESETSTVKIWQNHQADVRCHHHHCSSPPTWSWTSGGSPRFPVITDRQQPGPTTGSAREPGGQIFFLERERERERERNSSYFQERKSEIGVMSVRPDGTMCVVKVRISSPPTTTTTTTSSLQNSTNVGDTIKIEINLFIN